MQTSQIFWYKVPTTFAVQQDPEFWVESTPRVTLNQLEPIMASIAVSLVGD